MITKFYHSNEELLAALNVGVTNESLEVVTEGDYSIYNYGIDVQFKKSWTPLTRMCRGLVVNNKTGEILARPFEKFFNYGEMPETTSLPEEDYVVYPKWDGSLGICWYDASRNDWRITTRGSFASEQAVWATNYLNANPKIKEYLVKGFTYLFEIIYPENRIVVNYGGLQGLVLLSIIETATGREFGIDITLLNAMEMGCLNPWSTQKLGPFGPQQKIADLITICETLPANEEGFVIRFANGLRVKIKGTIYKAVHRLKSQLTSKGVWKILLDGLEPQEILRNIPDEFYREFMDIANSYINAAFEFEIATLRRYNASPKETRKEFALYNKDQPKYMQTALFGLLDGKKVDFRTVYLKGNLPK